MLQFDAAPAQSLEFADAWQVPHPTIERADETLEQCLQRWPLQRRTVQARERIAHAGQSRPSLVLLRAGCVRTSVTSDDGRQQVTGFRLRGDVLGMESIGLPAHACDAVALDTCELWEIPAHRLHDDAGGLPARVMAQLSLEIRRNAHWMMVRGTLAAPQRVAAFLLDMSERHAALGCSASEWMLRMTRADIANFLALTFETVARALTSLQAQGLIRVDGRNVCILDAAGLRARCTAQAPPLQRVPAVRASSRRRTADASCSRR